MNTELCELILCSKQKDKAALEELINHFTPLIRRFAWLLQYEDAGQDMILAFIEIVQSLPLSLLCSQSQDIYILSYIKKSMQNRYIFLSRQQRRFQMIFTAEESVLENIPDERDADGMDEMQTLQTELDKLTPLQKKVLLYRFCYGFSDSELSGVLHVSRQAVCQAKVRGLRTLREKLDNVC